MTVVQTSNSNDKDRKSPDKVSNSEKKKQMIW